MNPPAKPPHSGSIQASASGQGHTQATPPAPPKTRALPLMIPIRSLGPAQREQIRHHLLSLSSRDRYLRFGYPATDVQVGSYVQGLDFSRDEVFGILNRKLELIAVAHLAYAEGNETTAEFGVSVLSHYRGQGLGARMYDRAVIHARNAGVEQMYVHALSENTPMLRIARNAGSTVHRDGIESEAFLKLPPANFNSHMAEAIEEHYAEFDYQLKVQANHVQDLFENLQKWQRSLRGLPPAAGTGQENAPAEPAATPKHPDHS